MATAADLRKLALALEGTTEAPHFDRVAFRAATIYATVAADGKTANVKLDAGDQTHKTEILPEAFAPVAGRWGQSGWTTVTLSAVSKPILAETLRSAWLMAQSKAKAKPRARR
jgi:hypothetical protein